MINWSAPWMQEKNQFVRLWLAAEGHEDRRCDHIKKNDKMTSLNVLFCPQVLKKPKILTFKELIAEHLGHFPQMINLFKHSSNTNRK